MARRGDTWKPTVQNRDVDGVLVLRVSGRLGDAGARDAALRAAMDRAAAAPALVIDLSGVDYVSSPGLAWLLAEVAQADREHRALVVCGLTDAVRIAIDLADLGDRIPRASSVEEALEQFKIENSE